MTDQAELFSPALPPEKARFLTEGLEKVQGFLVPSTALYLTGIEYDQRGRVPGGICEIGVHRGKSFIAMTVGLAEGDEAVAIDIFDAQHLNMEATSVNALRDFKVYLERWGLKDRAKIIEGSSLDLEKEGFLEEGRRFRLFSVDGGHLDYHVLNDLRVAEATLVPGGIVAADDLLHVHYLGVITGVFQYLNSGGKLVPFALIPNKLLLTDAESVESNKARLHELFGAGLSKADVPFHDSAIDVYSDLLWTVVDTEGKAAPLMRATPTAEQLKKQVADLKAQVQKLARQRRNLRARVRQATEAAGPTGRADVLPKPLRRPARAVFRTLRRGAKPRSTDELGRVS